MAKKRRRRRNRHRAPLKRTNIDALEDQREEELQQVILEEQSSEEADLQAYRNPVAIAFLSNLPYHCTESYVMGILEQQLISIGKEKDSCIDVQFIRKRNGVGNSGKAIVVFENQQILLLLQNLSNLSIGGRRVKIREAKSVPKYMNVLQRA